MDSNRILCWFSCGAPSAIAAKVCLEEFGPERVTVVNCDSKPSEHLDNYRFFNDIRDWLGVPIVELKSEDYKTVDEVFVKTRYMSGNRGARCTTELKKIPRLRFAQPDDIHVFGFTADEKSRAEDFEQRNPDMLLKWILIEKGITRWECVRRLTRARIRQPAMYELGFDNNNCPGCVKAQSPWYWDMIRKHFPDVFKRRCEQSRSINCRLVETTVELKRKLESINMSQVVKGKRLFLDELPPGPYKKKSKKEHMSYGPECGIQLSLLKT